MSTSIPETPADFETAMAALESLVTRLEKGDLPLEQTLQEFQHGMGLVQTCQKALDAAQQRIEQLTDPGFATESPSGSAPESTSEPTGTIGAFDPGSALEVPDSRGKRS